MSGKKLNAYTCKNLHSIVTSYKDHGTTPMFITCPTCKERSVSRMGDVADNIPATHEWYKPTESDVINEAKQACNEHPQIDYDLMLNSIKDHVTKGGLLLREKK